MWVTVQISAAALPIRWSYFYFLPLVFSVWLLFQINCSSHSRCSCFRISKNHIVLLIYWVRSQVFIFLSLICSSLHPLWLVLLLVFGFWLIIHPIMGRFCFQFATTIVSSQQFYLQSIWSIANSYFFFLQWKILQFWSFPWATGFELHNWGKYHYFQWGYPQLNNYWS